MLQKVACKSWPANLLIGIARDGESSRVQHQSTVSHFLTKNDFKQKNIHRNLDRKDKEDDDEAIKLVGKASGTSKNFIHGFGPEDFFK